MAFVRHVERIGLLDAETQSIQMHTAVAALPYRSPTASVVARRACRHVVEVGIRGDFFTA